MATAALLAAQVASQRAAVIPGVEEMLTLASCTGLGDGLFDPLFDGFTQDGRASFTIDRHHDFLLVSLSDEVAKGLPDAGVVDQYAADL